MPLLARVGAVLLREERDSLFLSLPLFLSLSLFLSRSLAPSLSRARARSRALLSIVLLYYTHVHV